MRGYGFTSFYEQRLIKCCKTANWKSRAEILDYCIKVCDSRIGEQENNVSEKAEQGVIYDRDSRAAVALYEGQAKVRNVIQ